MISNTFSRLTVFCLLTIISFVLVQSNDTSTGSSFSSSTRKFKPTRKNSSSLNGNHLHLLALILPGVYDEKRNSSGHVISREGAIPSALQWLSQSYNFTYSFIPVIYFGRSLQFDDLPGVKGAISYLRLKEVDLIAAAVVPTPQRFIFSDFTMPWFEGPYSILIPTPTSTINIGALIQPMHTEIWLCIVGVVPIVLFVFYVLNKHTGVIHDKRRRKQSEILYSKPNIGHLKIFDYVIGILLSQGGYCRNKSLSVRLLATVWCLGCFVLIQAYSSNLISFITLPNQTPVIHSIDDIPKVPDLKITITRNQAAERYIMGTNKTGTVRLLQNILLQNPELLCNLTEDCLDKVLSGNHVYIHGDPVIRNIIANDKQKTGQCHFTRARDTFWMSYFHFAITKHSPYTQEINLGILRMKAAGLLDKWITDYSNHDIAECYSNKNSPHRKTKSQLTLKNMSSAFFLLIIGYLASLITFALPNIL